jgi:hypothetical protein
MSEINSKPVIIVGSIIDGGGKSDVIESLLDTHKSLITCVLHHSKELYRIPRQGESGRVWISQEIYKQLLEEDAIFSDKRPESYHGNVSYLYLKHIKSNLIEQIIKYNSGEMYTVFSGNYDANYMRQNISIDSIEKTGYGVLIESIPSAILEFKTLFEALNKTVVIPLVCGVSVEASIEGQLRRINQTRATCNPTILKAIESKAEISYRENKPHIENLLMERQKTGAYVFPVYNINNYDQFTLILNQLKLYIEAVENKQEMTKQYIESLLYAIQFIVFPQINLYNEKRLIGNIPDEYNTDEMQTARKGYVDGRIASIIETNRSYLTENEKNLSQRLLAILSPLIQNILNHQSLEINIERSNEMKIKKNLA